MRWRRVAAVASVGLAVPVAVGAVGVAKATEAIYPARDPGAPPVAVAAAPAHDPARPTAVMVLGPEGANVADVLAPYEVLAATGAFNLYTVAPERRPVPLTGGLDLVPDLSLGELDRRLPEGPEVIVVPQLSRVPSGLPPSVAPVVEWLRRQRPQGDRLLVGVCVGAEVLARAGLLDGRPATSHWLKLIGLRRDYPGVRWTDGVRYVEDGEVITTAGVLSGVDGALRVVERLVGRSAAERAARAVQWPTYHPGGPAPIRRSRPAPADVVALLSAGYRWDRPTMGVLLSDGVGETELAAVFRPYTELSYLAHPLAVTLDGRPVRSRHGLTFAPRASLATAAPKLDRLVVPGADAARRAAAGELSLPGRLAPVYLHRQPGFAFDAALGDIARTRDVATARWVAKSLEYPANDLPLAGPPWPWALTLRPVLLVAAAIAATLAIARLRRRSPTLTAKHPTAEETMHQQQPDESPTPAGSFPTDPSGLPEAGRPELLELGEGDTLELRVGPVAKQLGDVTVRMLGYNGSIPGPTLKVRQGSEIVVHVVNEGDLDTTVHWHGLRLENKYDGVPHETQAPIPVGGTFSYRIQFPDAGLYWYHPHIREDYTQELGLYGNILVEPAEPDYWPPADRELVLTVDDLLVEDGKVAPFSPTETSYAAMGRFGNLFLTSGEPELRLEARVGEVVRCWLTNTANTRVFNLAVPGVRLKLVGGDSGRVEHEQFVESVLLAPSERAVVDLLVEQLGVLHLEHHTPNRTYQLATLTVTEGTPTAAAARFEVLRRAPELEAERQGLEGWLAAAPDKVLALVAQIDDPAALPAGAGPVVYACPMHPEVTSTQPGRCPTCGMKLLATTAPQPAAGPEHAGMDHAHMDHGEMGHQAMDHQAVGQEGGEGIEWEDDMITVNRATTTATMHWRFLDRTPGADSPSINWHFTVGERVKLRLVNELDSDHPMHHPFHLHGAGRFLVLARDGVPEANLVWKDTVLVRTGQVVDILFDVSNPGLWMAHCHIAEHMQSGMMFSFTVARAEEPT